MFNAYVLKLDILIYLIQFLYINTVYHIKYLFREMAKFCHTDKKQKISQSKQN